MQIIDYHTTSCLVIGGVLGLASWPLEMLTNWLEKDAGPMYKAYKKFENDSGKGDWLRSSIRTSDIRIWSWQKFFQSLKLSLTICIGLALSTLAAYYMANSFKITFFIINLTIYGATALWIFLFLSLGLAGCWHKEEYFLQIIEPYQRFKASIRNFNPDVVKHIALRIILYRNDMFPLRLVHFLNEMSRRHLLEFDGDLDTETGGGAWRWRHRILQEYFLNKE